MKSRRTVTQKKEVHDTKSCMEKDLNSGWGAEIKGKKKQNKTNKAGLFFEFTKNPSRSKRVYTENKTQKTLKAKKKGSKAVGNQNWCKSG